MSTTKFVIFATSLQKQPPLSKRPVGRALLGHKPARNHSRGPFGRRQLIFPQLAVQLGRAAKVCHERGDVLLLSIGLQVRLLRRVTKAQAHARRRRAHDGCSGELNALRIRKAQTANPRRGHGHDV